MRRRAQFAMCGYALESTRSFDHSFITLLAFLTPL